MIASAAVASAAGFAPAIRLRLQPEGGLRCQAGKYEFSTEDFEYVRHGDRALKLRVFRPRGDGPFPATVIDLHGGAWARGDLNRCKARDEVLAASGLVAIALDFRHAGDGYPGSLIDINYAIRWVKANAAKLGVRADRIGLCGQSSGERHLAMLAAMRPRDPRRLSRTTRGFAAGPATVQCVAMTWPVINPLSRYHHAKRALDSATPPAWASAIFRSSMRPTGRPRPTWPRAIRCWHWSVGKR